MLLDIPKKIDDALIQQLDWDKIWKPLFVSLIDGNNCEQTILFFNSFEIIRNSVKILEKWSALLLLHLLYHRNILFVITVN